MAHWSDRLERVRHPDGRVLIGASFRGVPFFVESHDRQGGRRIVAHEFAKNDIPAYDDRGRKARTFSVTGYVLGVNYIAQRDALLGALEDVEGAGELIHPYLGPKRVRAGLNTMRESTSDGGMASFQLEFLDAPLSVSPTIVQDLASQVTANAGVAFVANQTEFESVYSVVGQPSFATESLRAEIVSLSESMEAGLAPIIQDTQELALLSVSIELITNEVTSLVRRPADIIDAVLNVVLQLKESILSFPEEVLTALLNSYSFPPTPDVLGDTSTRTQERTNQLALSDALRRAIVIQASLMLPDVTFETTGEATALRNRAVDALDALASTAGDTAYPSVVDLRAATARAVPGEAALASVQTIRRNVDLPSLVLSYQLYGSVEKEKDIVDRNDVQHPAFISGDIEVLSFG